MTTQEYLRFLIEAYKASYNITAPYPYEAFPIAAYGYFYALQEKYVLTREAQMWQTNGFDHAFFVDIQSVSECLLEDMDQMIRSYAEPELVRRGRKLPEKHHMYSDITIVLICEQVISAELVAQIKRYRFFKNYMFTIRGWCDARVLAVDLAENRVYGNAKAKPLLKFYQGLLTP